MKRLQRRDFLLLAPAAALVASAPWMSRFHKTRGDEDSWIGADGPLVVLQIAAAEKWKGAANFTMDGGVVQTDYDIACQAVEKKQLLTRRYGREMLVLNDAGHGAHLEALPDGRVALWQKYDLLDAEEHTIPVLDLVVNRVPTPAPSHTFWMQVQDPTLRLMAAADGGTLVRYDHHDVPIAPGRKKCEVWELRGGFVLLISPA